MSSMLAAQLESVEAMHEFGKKLSEILKPGDVIFLHGELGAGKTTLVQGILKGYSYHGNVKSPTYTLVESYQIDTLKICHYDLYRLSDPEELEWMGARDLFDADTISLIEWPDKGEGMLPLPNYEIFLKYEKSGRHIELVKTN